MMNFTLSFLSVSSFLNSPFLNLPTHCKFHSLNCSLYHLHFSHLFNSALIASSINNLIIKRSDFSNTLNSAIIVQSNDYKISNKFLTESITFLNGNLIISSCNFKSCKAPEAGGAIQASEINLALICTNFYRNAAPICGAAQLQSCFSVHWFGNSFVRNEADYNGGFSIDPAERPNFKPEINIESTNVTQNRAKMWTGAMRIDAAGGKIADCVLCGNEARVAGGFFDFSWAPARREVALCVFRNNSAKMSGGAVCAFHLMHSARYARSVFVQNRCESGPGAIFIHSIDSRVVLEESLFDGERKDQIGMKFGYSTFDIAEGTKFAEKAAAINKRADKIEKNHNKNIKYKCN